jgi:cytidylate kinase
VTIDGRVVTELGTQVDPEAADIRVDGRPLERERHRYVMLHKPAGYLSGADPRAGYPSWHELVKVPERLFAVGRLDQDSEGLLLLTNDGTLANALAHPRYGHMKTYLVQVEGLPNPRKVRRLQHGVMLDDGPTLPARVALLRQPPAGYAGEAPGRRAAGEHPPGRTSWLRISLREGRNRQVRRMVGLLGHPALRVIRTDLGPLHLSDLRRGQWRDLKPGEVAALLQATRQGGDQPDAAASERKEPLLVPCMIAIDGPAASGKSTIGSRLAAELHYLYFDTGVMYRALTWLALARGVPIEAEEAVTRLAEEAILDVLPPSIPDGRDVTVLADGTDITWEIRRPEVDHSVSPVSAYGGVREVMREQQRRIGLAGGVIMVGRDIGTVVLPEAGLKIYLDASLPVRAHRRTLERRARGEQVDEQRILDEMRQRDRIDTSRHYAPLVAAKDAIVVDSTDLTIEQVVERMHLLIRKWGEAAAAHAGSRAPCEHREGSRR